MVQESKSKAAQWGVPALVTAMTASVFVASVLREWAYFRVIGMDFITLLSPADYTSGVVSWLIEVLLAWVIGGLVVALHYWACRSGIEVTSADSSWDRWVSRFQGLAPYIIGGTAVSAAIAQCALTADMPSVGEWALFGTGCWLILSYWFVSQPDVSAMMPLLAQIATISAGQFIAVTIMLGHSAAIKDLARPSGEHRLVYATGEVEDNVQLLRATSNGILVLRIEAREVSFLTYSSFDRVDSPNLQMPRKDRGIMGFSARLRRFASRPLTLISQCRLGSVSICFRLLMPATARANSGAMQAASEMSCTRVSLATGTGSQKRSFFRTARDGPKSGRFPGRKISSRNQSTVNILSKPMEEVHPDRLMDKL